MAIISSADTPARLPAARTRAPRPDSIAGLRDLLFGLLAERQQVAVDEVGMRGSEPVRQTRIVDFCCSLDRCMSEDRALRRDVTAAMASSRRYSPELNCKLIR